MHRHVLASSLVLALLGGAASADALLTKSGKVVGFTSTRYEDREVGPDTWVELLPESKGEITLLGYAKGLIKVGAREYEVSPDDIAAYDFHPANEAWLDGVKNYDIGSYTQAFSAFQDVLKDPEARLPFKVDAQFHLALCLYQQGNVQGAVQQLEAWPYKEWQQTPDVHRLLAGIALGKKKYDEARKQYAAIEQLPNVPKRWVYTAQLGAIRVDIEERKYSEAEAAVKRMQNQLQREKGQEDASAQAAVLQSRIIRESGADDRLEEARKALEEIRNREDKVSSGTMAGVYNELGNVLFKQGKFDEARIPYMRVVCMFPSESDFVADGLLNAGKCFITLHTRAKDDPAVADQYLVEGMDLLKECGGKYKNTPSGQEARKVYFEYKEPYERIVAKREGK